MAPADTVQRVRIYLSRDDQWEGGPRYGPVLAYVLQMVSYVLLRQKFPQASRPYLSPVGVPGAVVAGVGPFCAGALLASVPVMALYFAVQRYLVGGLTAGSVK